MPIITCPYCANPVTLPESWTAPGFTCPHCRQTSALAVMPSAPAFPVAPPAPIQPPMALPLPDDEPFQPAVRSGRTYDLEPAPRNRAEEEARGKRLIVLGYAAFVVLPIIAVVGLAIYLFGGTDPKSDDTVVALDSGNGKDKGAKRPDPTPPRPTPRPRPDKDPDDGLPPPTEVVTKVEPIIPEPSKKPEATVAVAPAPHRLPEVTPVLVPEPIEIAVAPEPHVVRPAIAAPPGFVSEWEEIGVVEVRVAGVAVKNVPITNADGKDVDSPVPVLAIWLEIRTQNKSRTIEHRRWQDPLGSYAELTAGRSTFARANLGPGATLRMGLPYKQVLPADGTPRIDVLVFVAPPKEAEDLRLTLDADRVGETGKIRLTIPAKAWK